MHRARDCLAFRGGFGDAGVEAVDIADADLRHLPVAVLHLPHCPFQGYNRLFRIGHDRRQKVRNAVVNGQFQHLWVDHDQAAFLGLQTIKQGEDHRINGDRFA